MHDPTNVEYLAREHYKELIRQGEESRLYRSVRKSPRPALLQKIIRWFRPLRVRKSAHMQQCHPDNQQQQSVIPLTQMDSQHSSAD